MPPLPIVVDTDVGFDDLLAILYLLNRPEISIQAFTVVNGLSTVSDGANALLRLQEMLNLSPTIPVYLGATQDDQPNRLPTDYLDRVPELGWGAPQRLKPEGQTARDYFIFGSPPPTLLALGPLSDVGTIWNYGQRPSLTVWIMGGTISAPGDLPPPTPPNVEANFWVDPLAAMKTCAGASSLCLIPLDACDSVPLGQPFVDALNAISRAQGRPTLPYAQQIFARIVADGFLASGYYAWDPLAAVALVNPQVLENMSTAGVAVDGSGRATLYESSNAQVAMGANPDLFASDYIGSFKA